ncbi:hypothetical protein LEP1GSC103_4010 [Leptospira borgpetersenii serovar Javanica str. UI 09931]|uniref:Uncharacterized protein n=4 Tax=Leptospira borgpetersenii TaxID=174 RepID=M3H2X0_LEPBO|nr:hypothetical protein LBBP_00574 [Leptospira borgpetersenii serovar Ballum]EKQ91146.1 hypothetical protein LEP1GSC101_1475 [Leptospira borgpetersenii str. UI 09149]EKR02255.1 hypothetical protein LEP1GSC121_0864 [Leptospira borgpetersenii serovar Castellonis str. 200801910]EMG01439.1 hypothetical protein LEP1GSC123_3892 [Leptospira borgpetersenii str. 200701203]EMN15357.1 hypothetical protein LEP1GSC056_3997 [Leptospira borgpetersenii str. Brem 328]EMN59114.1 hypothetical protein LEP1GSC090_
MGSVNSENFNGSFPKKRRNPDCLGSRNSVLLNAKKFAVRTHSYRGKGI